MVGVVIECPDTVQTTAVQTFRVTPRG